MSDRTAYILQIVGVFGGFAIGGIVGASILGAVAMVIIILVAILPMVIEEVKAQQQGVSK